MGEAEVTLGYNSGPTPGGAASVYGASYGYPLGKLVPSQVPALLLRLKMEEEATGAHWGPVHGKL